MGRVGARVPTDGFGAHSSAHRTPTLENFYKKLKETVLGLGLKALSCLSSQDCGTVKHAEEGKGVSSLGGSLGSDGGRGRRGLPEPSRADRGGAGPFIWKRWP